MITDGWRGERTLLIGGSGFLGSAVLRLFPAMLSAGRTPPLTANRHIHLDSLGDLTPLSGEDFDRVILCTGTSRHTELMDQPLDRALSFHLQPTIDVGEQLASRKVKSFVRLSTVLLFDDRAGTLPIDERSPIDPYRNRYLLSQYLGEQAARFYGATTLRVCNTYGPASGQRTDIVHEIAAQLRESGSARIRSREPRRDFVYVDDAARAIAALALVERPGTFLLGSGVATSIGELADTLSLITGLPIHSSEDPVSGIPAIQVDSAKLRSATGWAPVVPLGQGLERVWAHSHASRD